MAPKVDKKLLKELHATRASEDDSPVDRKLRLTPSRTKGKSTSLSMLQQFPRPRRVLMTSKETTVPKVSLLEVESPPGPSKEKEKAKVFKTAKEGKEKVS
ncbi:unnamed protein product [Ilex paraguariensis]|uniref:Uncharacterized protein n=1 Tax=Ilex paraguariensis TaxID=185542 RepID=A0ABC8S4K2_9AQUA